MSNLTNFLTRVSGLLAVFNDKPASAEWQHKVDQGLYTPEFTPHPAFMNGAEFQFNRDSETIRRLLCIVEIQGEALGKYADINNYAYGEITVDDVYGWDIAKEAQSAVEKLCEAECAASCGEEP